MDGPFGTHERIRTSDPSLRRRVLYPAELRGQMLSGADILPQFGIGVNSIIPRLEAAGGWILHGFNLFDIIFVAGH